MTKYAQGSDGNVTFPTGYNAQINTWSATLTRKTHVLTGFGATAHNRRASGVLDITGSAAGVPYYWDGSSGSEGAFAPIKHTGGATTLADNVTGTIILFLADIDGAGDADAVDLSMTFSAVFSGYQFNVTHDGDSTIAYNFEMNDSNGPAVTWDETA